MSIKAVLAVGFGGALGACLRYMISLIPFKGDFPFSTLFVNIFGAFVLGFITGFIVDKNTTKELTLFLKTGMCGGFTTFSTFSMEAVALLSGGKALLGVVYVIISIAGTLLGAFLGYNLGKTL